MAFNCKGIFQFISIGYLGQQPKSERDFWDRYDTLRDCIQLRHFLVQNLLAVKAEEKLLLEYDVANPSSFIQQESYHKGQIELLQYLLDNSLACQRLGNESDSSLYNPDIF